MGYENKCLEDSLARINLLTEEDAAEAKLTEERASISRQIRKFQKRLELNAQKLETIRSIRKSTLEKWKVDISDWVAQDGKVTREWEMAG